MDNPILAGERPAPSTPMELVFDLMNFSPYGVYSTVFVLEAIRYYTECILSTEPTDIDGEAHIYLNVAKDISKRLESFYKEEEKQ